jgi:ComEC/Rec2-related protein
MPIALGLIAGIVVYSHIGQSPTLVDWLTVALLLCFGLCIVLKRAYFGVCCAAVAIGLLSSTWHSSGRYDAAWLESQHDYVGVIVKHKDYDGAVRCVVDIIRPRATEGNPARCIILSPTSGQSIFYGDTIAFSAKLNEAKADTDVPYEIDYQSFYRADDVRYNADVDKSLVRMVAHGSGLLVTLRHCREALIDRIVMSSLDPQAQTLLAACVAGEDTYLNPAIKEDFRASGIAHLLALSGFHVGIVVIIMTIVLYPMRAWSHVGRWRYVITMLCVWLYAGMLGFMPSVVRATVMLSVFMIAKIVQRKSSPYNSLSVAAVVILAVSPNSLYSPGFQLSFMAVLAILLFARAMNPIRERKHRLYQFVGLFTVPLAAMLGTGIISAYYFHTFPVLFLPVNVVMALLFPLFMIGGLAVCLLDAVSLTFVPLTVVVDFIYKIIDGMSAKVAGLSWAQCDVFMSSGQFVALTVAIVAVAIAVNVKRRDVAIFSSTVVAASIFAIVILSPKVDSDEFYITRPAGRTDLLIHHGDSCFLVTTAKPMLYRRVTSYAETHFAGYLRSRNCNPHVTAVDGDFSFGPFRRIGGQLVLGDKTMALIDGKRDVQEYADAPTYALVTRGFRGRISDVINTVNPDTVIIGHDCTPTNRERYSDSCAVMGRPCINVANSKFAVTIR